MEPLTRDDPQQIAGYRLHARLGAGGMGRVYLAATPGGRSVAVKVMRPELSDDPQFRDRFRQEIEAAARVHGLYTAQVVDADPAATPPWIATTYVPGPSLDQLITEHGPLPARTVFQLIAGVAEALQAIHAAGVVHRDLKPSNVLVAPDGPRVIDFGIARAVDAATLTRTGVRVGSPQFMAPEQIAGEPATPATDIFGLGSLAAYAALGRAPFGAADGEAVLYRILHQEPDLAGCPEPLRALILRCLAKHSAARPRPDEIVRIGQAESAGGATPATWSWLPAGPAAELASRGTMVATRPAVGAPPGATAGYAPYPSATRTGPPPSVIGAVRLMYAGAASAVLNAIVGSVAIYDVVHQLLANQPSVNQGTAKTVLALDVSLAIFFGVAGTGLWLWMAHTNRAGRSWARIVSTVLFGVLTVGLPLTLIQIPYLLARCTALAQWVLALAALVLLWVGPSNAYFAALRRSAGPV